MIYKTLYFSLEILLWAQAEKKNAEVSVKVFYEIFCCVFTKAFHFSFSTYLKDVQAWNHKELVFVLY